MTSRKHITASFAVLSVAAAMWPNVLEIAADLLAQEGTRHKVTVNRKRPLAEAVRALEQRHGVVITYEDPPYRHSSQLVNDSLPGRRPSFVPRGGPFAFEYVLPPLPSAMAMKPVLTAVVRQYYATGYAGKFDVLQNGDMFHIMPISRRAENGWEEPYDALLSTELSIVASGTEPSAMDALADLAENLRVATGTSVVLGTLPVNLLNSTKVPEWSGHTAARSELTRILTSTGRRLSWRLLYDAKGLFVLNVHML